MNEGVFADTTTFRNKRWRTKMPMADGEKINQFNRDLLKALGFPDGLKARKVTVVAEMDKIPIITVELIEYENPNLDQIREAARVLAPNPTTIVEGFK
jgi:hypothetical protein